MWRWVELKLTWKWCLTGKSDEHFVLSKLKQLFVCPPSTLAAVKLCRLIILILFLCLASAPTLSPTCFMMFSLNSGGECLYPLSDWRCRWCHFSLKDVADLILESPHYWSSFDVVMRRFHSTLSWCLCRDVFYLFLFWSMMMSFILSLLIQDDVTSPPNPNPKFNPPYVLLIAVGRESITFFWDGAVHEKCGFHVINLSCIGSLVIFELRKTLSKTGD